MSKNPYGNNKFTSNMTTILTKFVTFLKNSNNFNTNVKNPPMLTSLYDNKLSKNTCIDLNMKIIVA